MSPAGLPRYSPPLLALGAALLVPTLVACGSDTSFCERAVQFQAADLTADGLEAGVEEALATLTQLVESAPDEIVADVIALRDGVDTFIRTRRSPDREFAAAAQNVRAYLAEECGVTGATGS